MYGSTRSVFISYAWGGESEGIVGQIQEALQQRGITVIRDKRDLGYRGSIREFMERVGQGACVIVILSDRFLRSPDSMSEWMEIAKSKQFHDRIFPIVLRDTKIYEPGGHLEYVQYWEVKRAELTNAMKSLDPANLAVIREEIIQYDQIGENVSGLVGILKDMNTLTAGIHENEDFSLLLAAVERSMNEDLSLFGKGGRDASSPAEKVHAENASAADGKIQIGSAIPGDKGIRSHDPRLSDEVSFTAYHPRDGHVNTWHTLLVYAHVVSALQGVREDARRFADQIASPRETTSRSSTAISRGTELTIVPTCDGITFNPSRLSFRWMEDFHRAEFRFIADASLLDDAAKGQIDIFAGPVIIGSLKFAMLFSDTKISPAADHEEHSRMYNKDDVFISYSRKDKEVARAFKRILEATGLDVFLDVDEIRSGQDWQSELMRRIERAKIFQLFWSQNYSESENCRAEWEYALKQNKEVGFIRPVFWENPLSPRPPDELNRFNFKYVELNVPPGGRQ